MYRFPHLKTCSQKKTKFFSNAASLRSNDTPYLPLPPTTWLKTPVTRY